MFPNFKYLIIPSLGPGIMARRRLSVTDDGETCKTNDTVVCSS